MIRITVAEFMRDKQEWHDALDLGIRLYVYMFNVRQQIESLRRSAEPGKFFFSVYAYPDMFYCEGDMEVTVPTAFRHRLRG